MYHYVTDKAYLKQTYGICADLVNQLVQQLKRDDISARMETIGSKRRGLVTQNENDPIDYDFNLIVENADAYSAQALKDAVMKAFNVVLEKNGWGNCQDSTSAITTKKRVLSKGNKTPVSIDVGIVKIDSRGNLHRLIHDKTGRVSHDRWYWNMAPNSRRIHEMEDDLKPEYWQLVRDAYLAKKNMYLTGNDNNHPSFVCYIEALTEVYAQVHRRDSFPTGFFW